MGVGGEVALRGCVSVPFLLNFSVKTPHEDRADTQPVLPPRGAEVTVPPVTTRGTFQMTNQRRLVPPSEKLSQALPSCPLGGCIFSLARKYALVIMIFTTERVGELMRKRWSRRKNRFFKPRPLRTEGHANSHLLPDLAKV